MNRVNPSYILSFMYMDTSRTPEEVLGRTLISVSVKQHHSLTVSVR